MGYFETTNTPGYKGDRLSKTESIIEQSKKTKKFAKKKKEGTLGIVASDERSDDERWADAEEFMGDD